MDQPQLELDFESSLEMGNENQSRDKRSSAEVVNLNAVRKMKQNRENEELYKAIIESVKHIALEPIKRYK